MRSSWLLLASLGLSLSFLGCTKATVIGTPCMADADCNVSGQVCAPGFNGGASICTRKCSANTGTNGCPVGYDCFPTDTAKGATCNKTLYEVDAAGKPLLFGVDCAVDQGKCAAVGSGNAQPVCRKIEDPSSDPPAPVELDPNAYCSGACTGDFDCPLDFYCDTDYDGAQRCLRRTVCSPCTSDLNCPKENPVCVPTKDGSSRYCTKSCNTTGDCGGVQNTALSCEQTTSVAGASLFACLHRYGACVGEGYICDPCRKKSDCAKSSSSCIINGSTGERFCSKRCTSDASCTNTGLVKAACDNDESGVPRGEYPLGICNGDADHQYIGLFSCWLPQ
jgi:hypothetical protein